MRQRFKSAKIVVTYGGFGNQLFGWALARYLEKQGYTANLVEARESRWNQKHGLSSTSFSAFGARAACTNLSRGQHILLAAARRIPALSKWLGVCWTDRLLGFIDAEQCAKSSIFVGYHQNLDPSRLLEPSDFDLGVDFRDSKLSSRTDNYLELQNRDLIVVHVRGGDYRQHAASQGLLAAEYYVQAVKLLRHLSGGLSRVRIVSDDSELKSEVAEKLTFHGFSVRKERQDNLTFADDFCIMSASRWLVISNSTFSYWAANLGGKKTVAYPEPWRFDGAHKLVCPSIWFPVESSWGAGSHEPREPVNEN